ncbi:MULTISPECIES: BglG family transcription antiterminator [unclassified Paenibacillus]|uniref:BglG family transcription antiterminator n=1 Tax=unclassified Paenibacillus TaxID=185978 RepID=UPI001AE2B648|nr:MULTISPECIES: BglG family transcription antiterminator [unclassified Paenibacillus]MBP1157416.1 mannitol operon transcriptional antiterminator [Paenibacillus sp. PvP091]MBP1171846.1 mannitol operon transcriptional antiterminator [Paenibacillus sp. PvR098]MBP2438227.1 mannitol operon transcriptional antiterminator [Paenibacillus sp. PvP052]
MNVSNRQRQILELLLNRKDEITAGEIAADIKVSTRTVHRELLELENVLAAYDVSLHKKSGIGIQIQAESEQLDALKRSLSNMNTVEYSADERKALMLCTLLEADEPVKLFSLAHNLQVTVPTISSDLDDLEEWIQKSGLTLVRRRGYGVQLNGPEANKRNAICLLARKHLDDSDLFGKIAIGPHHPLTGRLLAMVGKDHWMNVEHALWQLEEKWPIELSEGAYTDLLIRLSVAITRIRQGKEIEPAWELHSGQETAVDSMTAKAPMVLQLSEALHLSLPPEEASYIAELLDWDGEVHPNRLLPQDDISLMETVQRLIRYIENQVGVPLSEDRSLREGLLKHIEPAFQRIRGGAHIRNPLLSQIKKDYELLFGFIRQGADEIITGFVVPDEEIGFLVLHFGASMERLKQFSRNVKAIVVCTSGIGSSKLLAIRLEKELPQIEIVGNVSWYEAARTPEQAYDLIISTVDLPLEPGKYFKLSPLLTKEETEKLRQYVQTITLKRAPVDLPGPRQGTPSLERLRGLKAYLDEMVSLMDDFKVFHLANHSDLQSTLQQACDAVSRDGAWERTEPIVEQLLERERYGTQVIPETGLALFHTRSELVRRPMLSLFRLTEALTLDSEHPTQVRELLLMLGPRELSKEGLEVLSEISALLLRPDMIRMLESGTTEQIKQFISNELAVFFENKTEMGRVT